MTTIPHPLLGLKTVTRVIEFRAAGSEPTDLLIETAEARQAVRGATPQNDSLADRPITWNRPNLSTVLKAVRQ